MTAEDTTDVDKAGTDHSPVRSQGKRKKLAAAATAGFVGLGSFALMAGSTQAFWNDAETGATGIDAGHLNLQISTDGGETWEDGTTTEDGAYAVMEVAEFDAETGYIDSTFHLRLSPDTTHDAVLEAEDIQTEVRVNDDLLGDYGYQLYAGSLALEGDVDAAGTVNRADGYVPLEAGDPQGHEFDVVVFPHDYVDGSLVDDADEIIWTFYAEIAELEEADEVEPPEFELPDVDDDAYTLEEMLDLIPAAEWQNMSYEAGFYYGYDDLETALGALLFWYWEAERQGMEVNLGQEAETYWDQDAGQWVPTGELQHAQASRPVFDNPLDHFLFANRVVPGNAPASAWGGQGLHTIENDLARDYDFHLDRVEEGVFYQYMDHVIAEFGIEDATDWDSFVDYRSRELTVDELLELIPEDEFYERASVPNINDLEDLGGYVNQEIWNTRSGGSPLHTYGIFAEFGYFTGHNAISPYPDINNPNPAHPFPPGPAQEWYEQLPSALQEYVFLDDGTGGEVDTSIEDWNAVYDNVRPYMDWGTLTNSEAQVLVREQDAEHLFGLGAEHYQDIAYFNISPETLSGYLAEIDYYNWVASNITFTIRDNPHNLVAALIGYHDGISSEADIRAMIDANATYEDTFREIRDFVANTEQVEWSSSGNTTRDRERAIARLFYQMDRGDMIPAYIFDQWGATGTGYDHVVRNDLYDWFGHLAAAEEFEDFADDQ